MNCKYCFQKDTSRPVYPIDNLEDKLIPILDLLDLDQRVTVNFIGGEAMLMQDKLMKCVRKFKKYERTHDVKFTYLLKTNGSKINDLVDLIDNGIIDPFVCISYDGENSDRSYIDCKTFKPLLKYKNSAAIHIALTQKSVPHLYDTIKNLADMGFMNFEYYYLYTDPIYEDQSFIDEFSAQLDKVMPLHCTGLIDLYNFGVAVRAKKEYDKTHIVKKGMSCNGIHNIDILPDGTFAVCGFLNIYASADDENVYDGNSSPMDVEKGCKFLKDFYAKRHCIVTGKQIGRAHV